MLTYVYECEKCQKTYDIAQPVTEAHLAKCPVCRSAKFRRIFTAPMVKTQRRASRRKSLGSVGDFGPEL